MELRGEGIYTYAHEYTKSGQVLARAYLIENGCVLGIVIWAIEDYIGDEIVGAESTEVGQC